MRDADNNVKLIVLDRLKAIQEANPRVLEDLVMDTLRLLGSSDIEVRQKSLQIALDMITSRNVGEVTAILKKELQRTHHQEYEKVQSSSEHFIALKHYPANHIRMRIEQTKILILFIHDRTRSTANY